MHAEDLIIDDGGQGEVVEYLGAVAPYIDGAVLAKALVVEAVDLGDLPGLMVPSDQPYSIRVTNLQIKRNLIHYWEKQKVP